MMIIAKLTKPCKDELTKELANLNDWKWFTKKKPTPTPTLLYHHTRHTENSSFLKKELLDGSVIANPIFCLIPTRK